MSDKTAEPLLSIFISHREEDRSLAEKIRDKLVILGNHNIEIFLFTDIQGGDKWQEVIEEQLRRSHVLIFLFTTDILENWLWCLYETGFFKGTKKNDINQIVCIKNKGIDPPSPLRNLQAYNASAEDIEKLLRELLQYGRFCEGKVINERLDKEFKMEFNRAIEEIVSEFSEARKSVDYFDKRISIELKLPMQSNQPVTMDGANITGDSATLKMLGLEPGATWEHLVEEQGDEDAAWLQKISESVDRIQKKKSPRQIMPGLKSNGRYFTPLLSRIEKAGSRPERLSIIFVESNLLIGADNINHDPFKEIPVRYKSILALLTIAMRLRWGILELYRPMLDIRKDDDLKTFCVDVLSKFDVISQESKKLGFNNLPDVIEALSDQDKNGLIEAIHLYMEGKEMLEYNSNLETPERDTIRSALDKIDSCNRQFIVACINSIGLAVAER